MRVAVVVLGDVGRSPRMCYHALSFAQHGCQVDLIGYQTSPPSTAVRQNTNIRLVKVLPPPDLFGYLPTVFGYPLKLFWMTLALLVSLLLLCPLWWRRTHVLLMQNPPGVPALPVCWFVARLKRATFVIDWHNYTHTILRHQFQTTPAVVAAGGTPPKGKTPVGDLIGFRKRLVQIAEWCERRFGPKADANLCVTHAMRSDLLTNWQVRAVTLYDRPPVWRFSVNQLSVDQKHRFFVRMAKEKLYTAFWSTPEQLDENRTRLSTCSSTNGDALLLDDRPALVVSATSWTADEDFGILLRALQRYDQLATNHSAPQSGLNNRRLPPILAVITGKGPMKDFYLDEISKLKLNTVDFLTPWLDAADYPTMLQAADLGVCLHTSTSGLDLPMKVVDMFGCGLPVLAKRFRCIGELVRDDDNGRTFNDAEQLCQQFVDVLAGFPNRCTPLHDMKRRLMEQSLISWEDNWDATVWPLFQHRYL